MCLADSSEKSDADSYAEGWIYLATCMCGSVHSHTYIHVLMYMYMLSSLCPHL